MHAFFFEMKQGHLGANRFMRDFTRPLGLTPDRVHMLQAIVKAGGSVLQRRLRLMLDVTKPAISVMVRALEQLGFVSRTRSKVDQRTFVVALTETAAKALRSIYFAGFTEGFVPLMLATALGKLDALDAGGFEKTLARIAERVHAFRSEYALGGANPWNQPERSRPFYYADEGDNPVRWFIVPTREERLRFSGEPPENIEDEEFPFSPYSGWPIWPAHLVEEKVAAVRKKDAAIAAVARILREHAAPR